MAWEEYSSDVEFIVQRTLIAAAACPNSKIVAAGYRYVVVSLILAEQKREHSS